jgi:purine catabolism regulator
VEGLSMGISVKYLLQVKELEGVSVLSENEGLDNEIKGVTIIEAPDIVKFINGGEVLLTGLYAFKDCSIAAFLEYLNELAGKEVSAIALKRGRNVDNADLKIKVLMEFSAEHKIPILDVPFDISFRNIMSLIMEHLFNEEVTRLKYFKTTHDNFEALVLQADSFDGAIKKIIDVLSKSIDNPVAVFDRHTACVAASDDAEKEFEIQNNARNFEPEIFSNYKYRRQKGKYVQYLIKVKLNFEEKLHLVITEKNQEFNVMDCIATESAINALQLEFAKQYAVLELEKKFQNDIMHNLLNGKIHSVEELRKNTSLLGVSFNGHFRVIVFGLEDSRKNSIDLQEQVKGTNILADAIVNSLKNVRVHNEIDRIVVIQEVREEQTQEEYRIEIRRAVVEIQSYIAKRKRNLKAKAGVGKVVEGIINLPESFKEANEASKFIDIAGDISEDGDSCVILFSDLGIFKLLAQLNEQEQLLEYIPEGLKKLLDYKRPQRDDLLITLKTYLDRNLNLSKTARDLYVHYKTASYRIEKIIKITGIDFDNANEVLAFRIGLVVYKMIEKHNKDYI